MRASTLPRIVWLGTIGFDDALVELVFGEYLAHHEVLLARRDRLDAIVLEQSTQGSWAPTVARLRCMRGIDTLSAVGLVAEIADITAFKHPKQLASYLGLVPSEHTSKTKRRQGAITKADGSHARRLLVKAAWHDRRAPRASETLRRRQVGQPAAAIDAAWRAQLRLHRRWAHLDAARAKKRSTVVVAVARELTLLRLGDRSTTRLTTIRASRSGCGWRPAPRHTGSAITL